MMVTDSGDQNSYPSTRFLQERGDYYPSDVEGIYPKTDGHVHRIITGYTKCVIRVYYACTGVHVFLKIRIHLHMQTPPRCSTSHSQLCILGAQIENVIPFKGVIQSSSKYFLQQLSGTVVILRCDDPIPIIAYSGMVFARLWYQNQVDMQLFISNRAVLKTGIK